MASTPTRRSVLAACGAGALSGCSNVLGLNPSPDIECNASNAGYAWPMAGGAADRSSRRQATDLPSADAEHSRLSRTNSAGRGLSSFGTPVVGYGTAYVAGDVKVGAYDLPTGEERWAFEPDGASVSPALGCGTLYVATHRETLALSLDDGSVLWRADVGTTRFGSPAVVDDTVYVSSGGVTALDAETGEPRWDSDSNGNALAIADKVYGYGHFDGTESIAAFTHDGDEAWRTEVAEVAATPTVADGTVYVAKRNGKLTALDAADGSVEWRAEIEWGVYSSPAVAEDRVVVSAGNGDEALGIDTETGEVQWRFETGLSTVAPTVVGDSVIVHGDGYHLLDLETGERLRHWPVQHAGSQAVVVDSMILYRAFTVSDIFLLL